MKNTNGVLKQMDDLLRETLGKEKTPAQLQTLKQLNDAVVGGLRETKAPTPKWEKFPLARTFFCQRYA